MIQKLQQNLHNKDILFHNNRICTEFELEHKNCTIKGGFAADNDKNFNTVGFQHKNGGTTKQEHNSNTTNILCATMKCRIYGCTDGFSM